MSAPYPPITELVPHEPPMLALEALEEWRDGHARCRLHVPHEGPLVEPDGTVEGLVTLELMAQGVAACLGMESWNEGRAVRAGMVVACRRLELERERLVPGEELVVEAERVRGNEASSHFEARVRERGGALVASATLTLVHGERPA